MAKNIEHMSSDQEEVEKLREFLSRDSVEIVTSKKNMRKVIEKSGGQISDDGSIKDSNGDIETAINGASANFENLESLAAGSRIYIEDKVAGFSDYISKKIF